MLPSIECAAPEVVCCPTLYDVAYHILTIAHQGLIACVPQGPCEQTWYTYVTMGDGDDGVMDALTVSLPELKPSAGSQRDGKLGPIVQLRADFRVRLIESGWPMAHEEDGVIVQPSPEEQNALARHAYARGESLYRRLVGAAVDGSILPSGFACSATTIEPLLPLKPSGGTIGWRTTVSLTFPFGSLT